MLWARFFFDSLLPIKFCQMHKEFFDNIDNSTVVIAPRGHGKTQLSGIVIPLFRLLEGKSKFMILIQSTIEKAKQQLAGIRKQLESNEKLIQFYGNQKTGHWNIKSITLKNGAVIQCHSTGSSIRGALVDGKRPDFITIDDLYNNPDRKNTIILEDLEHWFFSEVMSLPAKTSEGLFKITGTKFHDLDLFGVLAKGNQFKYFCYKAIKDDGTPLWKSKFTTEELIDLREKLGTNIFNQEYQGIALSEGQRILRKEWIHWEDELPKSDEFYTYIAVDPAITEKSSGDESAIVVARHYHYLNKVYIIEGYSGYLAFLPMTDQILEMYTKYMEKKTPVHKILIEAVSGFKAYQELLRNHYKLPAYPVTPKSTDKHTRLFTRSVDFERRKVIFWRKSKKLKELEKMVDQLINFPNHRNDDYVDAVVYLLDSCKK